MPNEESGLPVFVINGFLEAGKTQFLKFTLGQDYFQTDGKTLLLNCEEGEVSYPHDLLLKTHTVIKHIEDVSELSTEKLEAMVEAYEPERVIIEWNGMWPQSELRIPDSWFLNQQITIIDTSTFDMYLRNMKPLLGQMLKFSELVICNRADNIPEETLAKYYTQLRAMTQNAEIIFEGAKGEIRGDFNIELPYDINADHIKLNDDDFGYFYIDTMDRPQRYDGKTVEYTGRVLRPAELGNDAMVPGRMVMTCCEADVQFLGLIVKYAGAGSYNNGDWVKVRGTIKAEQNQWYGCTGPIVYASEVVRTSPVEKTVGFN